MTSDHEWIDHEIRAMDLDRDLVPVIDSWHKSHHSDPAYAWVPPGIHGAIYRAYVLHCLGSGVWDVSIAHIASEPDAIIGWIATGTTEPSRRHVHYAYVKQLYRRMRIATSLVIHALGAANRDLIFCTHAPRFVVPGVRMIYLPQLFYTPDALEWMRKRWSKKRRQLIEKDRQRGAGPDDS